MPDEVVMAAWMQLLSWLMLSAAGLVLVTMVTLTSLVPAVSALLGATLGAMATVLVSPPPSTVHEEVIVSHYSSWCQVFLPLSLV